MSPELNAKADAILAKYKVSPTAPTQKSGGLFAAAKAQAEQEKTERGTTVGAVPDSAALRPTIKSAVSTGVNAIKNLPSAMSSALQGASAEMHAGTDQPGLNPIQRALRVGSGIASTAWSPLTSTISAVEQTPEVQGLEKKISDSTILQKALTPTATPFFSTPKAGGNPFSQENTASQHAQNAVDLVGKLRGLALTVSPEHQTDILSAINIASSFLPIGGEAKAIEAAPGFVKGVGETAKGVSAGTVDAVKSLPSATARVVTAPARGVKSFLTPTEESIAKDWKAPASLPKAQFRATREILKGSPDIPETLVSLRLDPKAHIVDGSYVTKEAADTLRSTARSNSNTILRPALEAANYAVQRTPVEDVIRSAIEKVTKDKTIPASDQMRIANRLKKEGIALNQKYPEGLSLTDLHDNKITYDSNAGWKVFDTPATANIKTANRSVANTLRSMVEEKAPEGIGVDALNKEFAKYYKAADYLESLDSKKAPVSFVKDVLRKTAGLTGAGVAGSMGGGVGVEFAGYALGRAVEHMLENVPNPIRIEYMKNLKLSNPAAFEEVAKYMKETSTASAERLALPEGKPLGSPERPYVIKPKENSGVEIIQAGKGIPSRSPQTGRMFRTYSSTGEDLNKQLVKKVDAVPVEVRPSDTPKNQYNENNHVGTVPQTPPEVNTTIKNHLSSAEQVIKETPAAVLEKSGGIHGLMTQTQENIALSLEKAGMKDVAQSIRGIDLSAFKSFEDFKSAVTEYVKNIQPGLSMKDVSTPEQKLMTAKLPTAKLPSSQTYAREASTFLKQEPPSGLIGIIRDYVNMSDWGTVPKWAKTAQEATARIRKELSAFGYDAGEMTDTKLMRLTGAIIDMADKAPRAKSLPRVKR